MSSYKLAEVSYPSIGLGEQIAFAIQRKTPVICLYNEEAEKLLSKMLPRTKPNLLQLFPYEEQDLEEVMDNALSKGVRKKFEKFNFIITPQLNEFITAESNRRKVSKSELLRFIIEDWKKVN